MQSTHLRYLFLRLLECFTSAGTVPRSARKSEILNPKLETNSKFQIQMFQIKRFGFWILVFRICLGFRYSYFEFPCKARLAVVCTAGFPHSEISGSKVATHLPEAYRSYATSFIPSWCQGILHTPLTKHQRYALEIRNSKSETRNKFKILMFKIQNEVVLVIWIYIIWICLGFRYSCFEFPVRSAGNTAELYDVLLLL